MPLRNVITLMITFGTSFFSGPNFLLGTLLSQTSSRLSERQTNIHIHIHMQPVKLQPVHSDFKLRNHEQAHFKSTVCSINSMQHQQYAASTHDYFLSSSTLGGKKLSEYLQRKKQGRLNHTTVSGLIRRRQVVLHEEEKWFCRTKTCDLTRRRQVVLQDEAK